MPADKKITVLPIATTINAADISVLVDGGTDYQYTFTLLLQFLEGNLNTGAAVSFGTVLPQNTSGNNGDIFVNTSIGSFAQKISGVWTVVYTLPSANAADGTLLYGAGIPGTATGKNTDSYINTLTGIFYQKASGAWSQVFSMATGPQGPQGIPGTNGTNGTNGNSILFGTSNPSNSTTGVDGNFFINTSNYTLFGPKASGAWPAGVSILGSAGPTGATGPQGATGSQGPAGSTGAAGAGVSTGGTTGQVLSKNSNTDFDTIWTTPPGGTPGGSSNQLQYNNAGAFAGSSKLAFDGTILNINNAALYLGAATMDASAVLQADSATKGVLFPRMTEAQRLAITSPAQGLQVYQTDAGTYGEGLYQYKSTGWVGSTVTVAGSTGQILYNNAGAFAATANFAINSSNQLYFKGPSYTTVIFNSPQFTNLQLQSNGTTYAYIGSGQSSFLSGATDLNIIAVNISLEGNIFFNGVVNYTTGGVFGKTSANAYLNYNFGPTGAFYWEMNYKGTSLSNFGFSNAGNGITSPDDPDNLLIQCSNHVCFWTGANSQSAVWAMFNSTNRSLILNGGGSFSPIASAQLQIDSTAKGVVFPRMTTTQKNAISSPVEGLIVYDNTLHKLCVFTGSTWETVTSS